jgi:hypothetical protein
MNVKWVHASPAGQLSFILLITTRKRGQCEANLPWLILRNSTHYVGCSYSPRYWFMQCRSIARTGASLLLEVPSASVGVKRGIRISSLKRARTWLSEVLTINMVKWCSWLQERVRVDTFRPNCESRAEQSRDVITRTARAYERRALALREITLVYWGDEN